MAPTISSPEQPLDHPLRTDHRWRQQVLRGGESNGHKPPGEDDIKEVPLRGEPNGHKPPEPNGRKPAERDEIKEAIKFDIRHHMEPPPSFKCSVTEVVVGEGGFHKIWRYDMRLLVRYSACATMFAKGTVFTMDGNTVRATLFMLLLLALVTAATVAIHAGDFEELRELDTSPLQALTDQVSAFVPFVLALFVSLALSRWWALRVVALGRVFDSLANTCMMVSCELRTSRWKQLRLSIVKYGMASVELLVQAAREHNDLDELVNLDLITESEAEFLREYELLWQRPMVMWAWMMHMVIDAMDHNKTPVPSRTAVIQQCLKARDGMANINMYLDTQLPFAYVHLITLLVNVQNLLMSLKSGLTFAVAMATGNSFVMIQQVLTTVIIVVIYQALLTISYMIMDPFGDDVLDFPIGAYKVYVASSVDAMMGAGRGCPAVCSDGCLHRAKYDRPKPARKTEGGVSRL